MIVVQRRGGAVETEHEVAAVLVRDDGRVEEAIGPVDAPVTWRSAAKPFQLEVTAPLAGYDWKERELAVGASSHWGEPVHVALVEGVLARSGLSEAHLYCGPDWPGHFPSKKAAIRATDLPRPIWNNCSGKHSFMATACAICGWDADYRPVDHPLQAKIRASVAERTGHPASSVVDGCGVPSFVLPIGAMGRAWAGLARSVRDGDGWLGRIGAAMQAWPVEAGGEGAVDTSVVQRATRRVIAKVGAEGLICVAVPDAMAAAVVKVRTGSEAARAVALAAVLERWFPGLVPQETFAEWTLVRNVVGREVGERTVSWG
jgi:L-asparaginase II